MRLMPGQSNSASPDASRRDVDQRLSALRGLARGDQRSPGGDRPTMAPGYARLIGLTVALVLALLALVVVIGLRDLKAPPRATAGARLPSGVPVRLVAVTRGAPQAYRYEPRGGLCARFLQALGARRADGPVASEAQLPADALTLWLWVGAPYQSPRNSAAFADDNQREYRNSSLIQPIITGTQAWPGARRRGAASLVWVSLTSYDHTAKSLTAVVPIGWPGQSEPAPGEVVRFTVPGPAQAPQPLAASDEYPVVAGNGSADLRLWQLRRVELPVLRALLPIGPVPEPAEHLVMADVDMVEKDSAAKPGSWFVQVLSAVTEHGEKLLPAQQRNGLAFLTNGRRVDNYAALAVKARAAKLAIGGAMLKFRQLPVPAERGETVEWSAASQAEPYPGGRFMARRSLRASDRVLRVEIEGRGPADAEAALAFVDALDQAGRHLKLQPEATSTPAESSQDAAGCYWRWAWDLAIEPDTKFLALAYRLDYRATMASTPADLVAKVQPSPSAAEQAAWGVMLEPRGEPDPKLVVIGVQPGSRAAAGPLQPGDELLKVDALPAAMVNRALLRRRPGERVTVVFRRGEATFTAEVGLDAHG